MKCEDCGKNTDGVVCRNCGLVIDDKPISRNSNGYASRKEDITTLYSSNYRSWTHPLSPNIRSASMAFKPRYQKKYIDYVYIKAYESIGKLCSQLRLPIHIKNEALNLFKDIRKNEPDFFQSYKLAPTYLACIKIACKINDFPVMNYELFKVIDYEVDINKKNISYMDRKFNRAYRAILKLYGLKIKTPERPNFISFACNRLNLPTDFMYFIYEKYAILKKFFQPHFRIEGYILAIIYIYGNECFGFFLKTLEDIFHTSSKTIAYRKNEILNIIKKITR